MNRKMMNLGIGLCFACVAALMAASCTDDADDGNRLPEGKYPMTFTASVDGLPATRATTDTYGKTSWENNDPVAISMDGGANHKQYKITDTGTGAMSPDGEANILYWSKTQETLAAWYPIGCTIGSGGGGSEVSITDQSSSFGTLENILHAPAKGYTYSSGNPVAFTFRHALAKVKVTLQKGEGIEDSDLSGAAVTFMGYTAGTLGYGGMTGSGSNGDIIPKTETANGSATTYTALLIPQQMQGKKFIKVTVGGNNYYYTPKGVENGNLRAGYVDNYTITVKQNGLSVVWQKGELIEVTPEEATFKIYLADFSAPVNTTGYAVTAANGEPITASNGVYTLAGNELNISLSAAENYRLKTFLAKVTAGICKQKVSYAADTRTYTYTFHDVRSDLFLAGIQAEAEAASTRLPSPQTGDYYYADGTWSPTLAKPCIGIVFKVGAGQDDQASNYGNLADNAIHGYAVALNDAHTAAGAWGIRLTDVSGIENNGSAGNKYDGYKNTTVVHELPAYSPTDVSQPTANGQYWAFKVASEYAVATPDNTSGWYLPSIQQLADINGLSGLASRLTAAGGAGFKDARYWSSTEKNNFDAWYYRFDGNGADSYAKSNDGANYLRASYVRAVLTF